MSSAVLPDPTEPLQWIDTNPAHDFTNLPSISFAAPKTTSKTIEAPQSVAITAPTSSGNSLPEIPCEVPQAAVSTQTQLPTLEGLPQEPSVPAVGGIRPATNFIATPTPVQTVHIPWWQHYGNMIVSHPLRAFLAISLTVESIYGVFESVGFVTREYPLIEVQLQAHALAASELNALLARIIAIVASTVLSAFFALKLSFNHSKEAEELHLAISGVLFFVNIYLFTAFTGFPLFTLLQKLGDSIIILLTSI